MSRVKYMWIDIETSGRSSTRNGIVQAAFMYELDGKIVDRRSFSMNPANKEIDKNCLSILGITEEDLKKFDLSITGYKDIKDWFSLYVDPYERDDKFVPAGYNILRFDMNFLRNLWSDNNDRYFHSFFTGDALDLVGVIEYATWLKAIPKLPDGKLETVAKYFGLSSSPKHEASVDVQLVYDITKKLTERIQNHFQVGQDTNAKTGK